MMDLRRNKRLPAFQTLPWFGSITETPCASHREQWRARGCVHCLAQDTREAGLLHDWQGNDASFGSEAAALWIQIGRVNIHLLWPRLHLCFPLPSHSLNVAYLTV